MTGNLLLHDFIFALRKAEVKCCLWKNINEFDDACHGKDDLDILVQRNKIQLFRTLASEFGFKEASSKKISFPFVYHFYGYDKKIGKIIHLHVYTRLITGQSHTKNYFLPFEDDILNSVEFYDGVKPLPSSQWLRMIFIIRFFIKISGLADFCILRKRLKGQKKEFGAISALSSLEIDTTPLEIEGYSIFRTLSEDFNSPSLSVNNIIKGLKLRWQLRHLRRKGTTKNFLLQLKQIVYRVLNKLFFKQKKRFFNGGAVVIITGPDGAGKTTITDNIIKHLSINLDIKRIHMGRPPATLFTSMYRILRSAYKRKKRKVNVGTESLTKSKNKSIIHAVHLLFVAYERSCLARKIFKLRNQGFTILGDRYRSLTPGVMDGPRILSWNSSKSLINKLGLIEEKIYSKIPKADLCIELNVPVEMVVERNRKRERLDKETDSEIRQRYDEFKKVKYAAEHKVTIDGSGSLTETINAAMSNIWHYL